MSTRLPDRYAKVTTVLVRVLLLNLAVAIAKLVFGYMTGALSIVSDGFHSLADSTSNITGLVGVRVASRPPDEDHPYGHRKYETLAAALIVVMLGVVVLEVVQAALDRLESGAAPQVSALSFAVMFATVIVNLIVVRYESRRGRDLSSELLIADSMHTKSDVLTSVAVIASLAGVKLGFPILDAAGALIVAVFIGNAAFEIARDTARILTDRTVLDEDDLRAVAMGVPGVLGCHRIRTRGSSDHAFLDLHVWFAAELPLRDAHRLSHEVKDRLMARYPQIGDAIIHIEPPPDQV
jgi:cation diffusion facilitator family transporter